MKFLGFQLLLFAVFCIVIATGRSIDGQNSFTNSESVACRGGYGGGYMPPETGGGGAGNGDAGTNGDGNEAGGAADGVARAMSTMANMASAMMDRLQQAMG